MQIKCLRDTIQPFAVLYAAKGYVTLNSECLWISVPPLGSTLKLLRCSQYQLLSNIRTKTGVSRRMIIYWISTKSCCHVHKVFPRELPCKGLLNANVNLLEHQLPLESCGTLTVLTFGCCNCGYDTQSSIGLFLPL